MRTRWASGAMMALALAATPAGAGVLKFGEADLLGTGAYPSDPTAGATLQGLAPGAVTLATDAFPHPIPTKPDAGAYPGTGQIYTVGAPTAGHDSYSASPLAAQGPDVVTMSYGGLVPAGQAVQSLTLGVAADDFQQPNQQQPFAASVNGVYNGPLSDALNALNLSGPKEQFLSVGIAKEVLNSSNTLTLSITRAGAGRGSDGWAVDFTTVGVTTAAVPEPPAFFVFAAAAGGLAYLRRRRA